MLNTTTSTRPQSLGRPVVRSIEECKRYESVGAGFATPPEKCTLQLPNSFASGDGKALEAVGIGTTQQEASEDACLGAMVKLLLSEPQHVLLRPTHWKMKPADPLAELCRLTGQQAAGSVHQPLAVPAAYRTERESDSAEKKATIAEGIVRRCLETHGGAFDPSRISRRKYGLQEGETPPWHVLGTTVGKGELRTFIQQHPDFQFIEREGKTPLITWSSPGQPTSTAASSSASGRENASQAARDQALPVDPPPVLGTEPLRTVSPAIDSDQALPVHSLLDLD